MIKVIEAISDTNIGGAGILLENRLIYTNKKFFDTTVVLPQNSMLKSRLKENHIKLIEIAGTKDKSLDLKSIFEYTRIISKIKPDIINSHGCLSSRIAASVTNTPIRIYTRHCVFPIAKIYKIQLVRHLFSKITETLSHRIIAVSPAAKANLIEMGINKKRIKTIINGAKKITELNESQKDKIREKLGIEKDKIVVSIFARLKKYKDHRCFIKAAYLLNQTSDKYIFLIVGNGSEEKVLKKMSQKLNLCDKIIFTGFVNDVTPYMNITDINVNCSIGTETSSLALSEGMSLGIPSVVSNYGGNPYMIQNGINGYVYRASDYKDLALKIEKITKGNNYKKFSQNSKIRFSKELNAEDMSRKTQEFYKELYQKIKIKGKRKMMKPPFSVSQQN